MHWSACWVLRGQRVLLTAAAAGLVSSLISQPIDVPAVREELRVGLRRFGSPAMLLQTGYGIGRPPTPRRAVDDVLVAVPAAMRHRPVDG